MKTQLKNKVEEEILSLENQLKESKTKLAKLRRELPPEEVQDYTFKGSLGENLKLSELFGNKNELILIHNMGKTCPYCTMWADGFNGIVKHLENRASFVLESADDFETQRRFALERGWTFRMVSSKGSSFKKDMGFQADFEGKKDTPMPGVSVFYKKNGKIYHGGRSHFGPGDNYCIVWDLFDLLPAGRDDWEAKFHYYP